MKSCARCVVTVSVFVQVLGVLSQDGIMRFININTCKLLFDIGTLDSRISNVAVSPSGRYIVAVLDSGNMHLYNVQALTSELNKVFQPKTCDFCRVAEQFARVTRQFLGATKGVTLCNPVFVFSHPRHS